MTPHPSEEKVGRITNSGRYDLRYAPRRWCSLCGKYEAHPRFQASRDDQIPLRNLAGLFAFAALTYGSIGAVVVWMVNR